jgi:hypothetical protein
MRTLLLTSLVLVLASCGSDKQPQSDASTPSGDGAVDPDGSNGTIDAAPLTLDCDSYCAAIMETCTGDLAQYDNMQNCVDSCANFPTGALTDSSGNTLGCRVYYTEAARGDAQAHCEHAGPGGGGMCGATICAGFCSIVVAECPTQWPSNALCTNATTGCPAVTSTPPYKAPSTGNTIQCRLYHATMAATDPGGHCGHTVRLNNPVCN